MSPFVMILLALLVVYFVSRKKQPAEGGGSTGEPDREPLQVTLAQGCWSCTPEELLEDLSHTVMKTGSRALPVYVYGQGYEVRDLRHWVTLLTEPSGRLAEAVITWCPDGEQAVRQAAAYYAGTLLSLLAAGESEPMIREINALISKHKAGQRDELVRSSAMSRVCALVTDEPRRLVTIRITPMLPEELAEYRASEGEGPAADTASEGDRAEPVPDGNDPV